MTRRLVLIATASMMASAHAAPVSRGTVVIGVAKATVQLAKYHANPQQRRWRRDASHWQEPWIWRYKRTFRSNATDFYGSRQFQGR